MKSIFIFGVALDIIICRIAADDTVEIAKEVVDCGLWYIAEYENNEFTLNYQPKEFSDVADYLKKQSRFRHLHAEDIEIIKRSRDAKWETIRKNFKINQEA